MLGRPQRAKKGQDVSREAPAPSGGAALKSGLPPALERQIEKLSSTPLAPGLYLVATPIGHLGDITLRALFTLAAADAVLCEDTRHSRKLFSAYGIGRKLQTYHDFSGEKDRARVLTALQEGKSVALISDAGTPLIADPGYKLVRAAIAGGFGVYPVPGASAVIAALVSSGLPTDQVFFGGFLPPKERARREALETLRGVPGTLIFYETPSRIEATLTALSLIFPGRLIVLARELTKMHEAFARGSAQTLMEEIREYPPLGELVVLIGPGKKEDVQPADVEQALRDAMARASLKEAVEEVAKGLGVGKKQVYNLALRLKDRSS